MISNIILRTPNASHAPKTVINARTRHFVRSVQIPTLSTTKVCAKFVQFTVVFSARTKRTAKYAPKVLTGILPFLPTNALNVPSVVFHVMNSDAESVITNII